MLYMADRLFECVVPRGFSRYFILETLKEEPHTGKEIIESAERKSKGVWKPSPGLIYPMLARLASEKLIVEKDGGMYSITDKGKKTSEDIDRIGQAIKKQIDTVMALGNVGKFVLSDMVERLVAGVSGEYPGAANTGGVDEYREFLKSELERLDAKKNNQD
ncbi:MAG: transcriptional regulator PadR-like family [Cenarchaeum symbiont of Oopsacas minuta]|nr:transcriptional regulator PadR-like family [Cenarchaeum symbiont of Oopsacas minuta]